MHPKFERYSDSAQGCERQYRWARLGSPYTDSQGRPSPITFLVTMQQFYPHPIRRHEKGRPHSGSHLGGGDDELGTLGL